MDERDIDNVQRSYDEVAGEYVQRIADELKDKPLDRELLDRFATNVRGVVCDLGCGPGHVGRYLHERGARVLGIDLSPALIEQATQRNPGIDFRQGDMRALDLEDGTLGGIVAFYSLIHIPRGEMVPVLAELRRVLRPGGLLLLVFHIGTEALHLDEWWGHPVCVDFYLFRPEEMAGYLASVRFVIEDIIEREPYPEVEHQSRRAYIFARSAPIGDQPNFGKE